MSTQVLLGVADNWGMNTNLKYAAECPLCHTTRETVWFRVGAELVCRDHQGHPLFVDRQRDTIEGDASTPPPVR